MRCVVWVRKPHRLVSAKCASQGHMRLRAWPHVNNVNQAETAAVAALPSKPYVGIGVQTPLTPPSTPAGLALQKCASAAAIVPKATWDGCVHHALKGTHLVLAACVRLVVARALH